MSLLYFAYAAFINSKKLLRLIALLAATSAKTLIFDAD